MQLKIESNYFVSNLDRDNMKLYNIFREIFVCTEIMTASKKIC